MNKLKPVKGFIAFFLRNFKLMNKIIFAFCILCFSHHCTN